MRLFCFPYAGGGAAVYRGWFHTLSSDIELGAVRLPGRETRVLEPPADCWSDLVRRVADGVAPLLDLPFALFGHSMGALIAFELARELRRRDDTAGPVRLFVSGARAPTRPHPDPPLRHLSDRELVKEVHRRYGAVPPAVIDNSEFVDVIAPCLRADFTLVETYRYAPGPAMACPISCFSGSRDRGIGSEDLVEWSRQTANTFRMRMFDGDHFFLESAFGEVRRAVEEELGLP